MRFWPISAVSQLLSVKTELLSVQFWPESAEIQLLSVKIKTLFLNRIQPSPTQIYLFSVYIYMSTSSAKIQRLYTQIHSSSALIQLLSAGIQPLTNLTVIYPNLTFIHCNSSVPYKFNPNSSGQILYLLQMYLLSVCKCESGINYLPPYPLE